LVPGQNPTQPPIAFVPVFFPISLSLLFFSFSQPYFQMFFFYRLHVATASFVLACQSQLRATLGVSVPTAPKAAWQNGASAVGFVLGCGGPTDERRLDTIRSVLLSMWETLPQSRRGRVGHRSLRHLAHRYFMRHFSIAVRGLDPSWPSNESNWSAVTILSDQVSSHVKNALESQDVAAHGSELDDAVRLVAALENFLFDSQYALLLRTHSEFASASPWPLGRAELKALLKAYLVRWLLGENDQSVAAFVANETLLEASLRGWKEIVGLVESEICTLDRARQRDPRGHHGACALSQRYSLDEAYKLTRAITESFAAFWESKCMAMEEVLVEMDKRGIGRLSMYKFYGAGIASGQPFSESEAYLKELGVLDETSVMLGRRVIIPNYLTSTTNCVVSSEHYRLCCRSRCDDIRGEIEAAVSAPMAPVELIAAVVRNVTVQVSLDEEYVPDLDGILLRRLEHVAEVNGGQVPVHGRLFAQWLHYAYPRECPFPGRGSAAEGAKQRDFSAGVWASMGHMQLLASLDEPLDHIINSSASNGSAPLWMAEWTPEEELALEYDFDHDLEAGESIGRRAGARLILAIGGISLLVLVARRCDVVLPLGFLRHRKTIKLTMHVV